MKKTLFLILVVLLILSCSKNDNNENPTNCDFEILISKEQYASAPADQLAI